VPQRGLQEIANGNRRQLILFPACFKADEVCLRELQLRGIFNHQDSFVFGNELRKEPGEGGLACACAARNQNVLPFQNIVLKAIGERAVERACTDQILQLKVACTEFADGECDASETAWGYDRGYPAAVRQSRIENGLRFRNVVSQTAGDVFDGNQQRLLSNNDILHLLEVATLFDEDAVRSVHHYFADGVVEDEVLDGFQKWENNFESIHQSVPSASCSKYDLFGSL